MKKVLCIDNFKLGNYLTTGKWYDVIEENKTDYRIIDDRGNEFCYPKWCFKTQAEVREEKLNELGI